MHLRPDNIRKVRDAIAAAPPELFTMAHYGAPACGTPGCIAGWASSLAEPNLPYVSEKAAGRFLGTEDDEGYCASDDLFWGGRYCAHLESLTRADALFVLDWLLTLDRDPTGDEIADAWDRAVAARGGETGRG